MTGPVVGLDPSLTACGIAILRPADGFSATGSARVTFLRSVGRSGRKGDGWERRSARIVAQTRRIVAHVPAEATLVVLEAMPAHMPPQPYLGDRWALWFGVHSALNGRVPIAVVNPSTRARWATGKGTAAKADVLAAVREQWPNERIADDNQADALTLASIGAHYLGWPLPFETKPRHTTGLQAVEWPEGVGA